MYGKSRTSSGSIIIIPKPLLAASEISLSIVLHITSQANVRFALLI